MNQKRYIRIGSVLVIAFGTGHVMQNGGAIAGWLGLGSATAAQAVDVTPATQVSVLTAPGIGDARGLTFLPGAAEVRAWSAPPQRLLPPETTVLAALQTTNDAPSLPATPDCQPRLTAAALPGAMVGLQLTAACHPLTPVTINHGAIAFVERTDDDGRLALEIPALAVSAQFSAALAGLEPVDTRLEVPAATDFHRVAVAWQGDAGIELHAFEFGAAYDHPGHVWRGNPRDVGWALRAEGGYSTLLGTRDHSKPQMAEIYSFPADARGDGSVHLTVEAAVTQGNCGADVGGLTQQVAAGIPHQPVEISLAMPGCEATGDFLVLNDLFRDLTIAD